MALKIAIYTAVFGGKDVVKEPIKYVKDENIDYYLITDEPEIKSKCHNIIYKKPIYDDITKNARYYKIIGLEAFKNYDFIIWHDANLQINHNEIHNLISFASENGLAFYRHSERNCIYDEAIKCIVLEKDFPHKLLKQVFKYFFAGVKNNIGLFETGIYIKNNQYDNVDFTKQWWSEIKHNSRRDQISLPYCLRKFKIEPAIIVGDIRKNKFSRFHRHEYSEYNFLSLSKPKPFNKWSKAIALKLIKLIKKING